MDPFAGEPATEGVRYFRLHGRAGYQYQYSDTELHELRSRVVADGRYSADRTERFEIQGEGKIIGVDNGNPASHEGFKRQPQEGVESPMRACGGQVCQGRKAKRPFI